MKLTHVRLLVDDFDACFRFYRDMMGFQVQWGAEGADYAAFSGRGEAMVALFSRQAMAETLGEKEMDAGAEGSDRSMIVFEAADLDSTVEALRARGARFVTELQDRPDWGIRTAHLRDPEGNLIELNSPLLESQWSDELVDENSRYVGTSEGADTGSNIGDTPLQQ